MKKVGYFFFSFLPILATLLLQFVLTIPLMGFALIGICMFGSGRMEDLITMVSGTTFSTLTAVLYAAAGICIFGIWYQLQFHGSFTKDSAKHINLKLLAGILCLVPILQVLTGLLATGIGSLFPKWMELYEELMEMAGFTESPSFLLVLYAIILGPVSEELTFRGVTMTSFKRALPFWAANLLQALLFGIFHLNLIQGIYAFFLGLVLGYICEKSGSIWYTIVLHIAFNCWGTYGGVIMSDSLSPVMTCVLYLIFIFLGILGLWLFAHNLPPKEKFTSLSKESEVLSDI